MPVIVIVVDSKNFDQLFDNDAAELEVTLEKLLIQYSEETCLSDDELLEK